ncbi:protein of unknown function [Candidatus Methylocalor cossyra]|uniref:Uncharacterized protein n=1 Tax=Candidatus Methylocalor cossyra TaxID=3108543 RepID=A0ABM9NJU2_9GAMM
MGTAVCHSGRYGLERPIPPARLIGEGLFGPMVQPRGVFQAKLPYDSGSLMRWWQRIGEGGVEGLLVATIAVA